MVKFTEAEERFTDDTLEPAFIIIGAQKSGTTSLFKYLQKHPQVLPLEHTDGATFVKFLFFPSFDRCQCGRECQTGNGNETGNENDWE